MSHVAQTISQQIKYSSKWAMMSWGAHNVYSFNSYVNNQQSGLQFDTRGFKIKNRNARVMVTYNEGQDLYEVFVGYTDMKKLEWVEVRSCKGVYCDSLVSVIDDLLAGKVVENENGVAFQVA